MRCKSQRTDEERDTFFRRWVASGNGCVFPPGGDVADYIDDKRHNCSADHGYRNEVKHVAACNAENEVKSQEYNKHKDNREQPENFHQSEIHQHDESGGSVVLIDDTAAGVAVPAGVGFDVLALERKYPALVLVNESAGSLRAFDYRNGTEIVLRNGEILLENDVVKILCFYCDAAALFNYGIDLVPTVDQRSRIVGIYRKHIADYVCDSGSFAVYPDGF